MISPIKDPHRDIFAKFQNSFPLLVNGVCIAVLSIDVHIFIIKRDIDWGVVIRIVSNKIFPQFCLTIQVPHNNMVTTPVNKLSFNFVKYIFRSRFSITGIKGARIHK